MTDKEDTPTDTPRVAAGRKGGRARASAMSAEDRSESARNAANLRWGGAPKAEYHGELRIPDVADPIPCAVLDDRRRVLSQRGFAAALGAATPNARRATKEIREVGTDDRTPHFLSAKNLKPFISEELQLTTSAPILYRTVGGVAYGIPAELIPDLCFVWLKARDAGVLHARQAAIAARADMLVRGFSKVGIIALVDEATGYQADRRRGELSKLLDAYVERAMRPWIRMFPEDFFREIHRLQGWPYQEGQTQHPQYIGTLINNFVYKRLPTGVLEELQRRNPRLMGRRRAKHHQFLTQDTGVPHLDKQIFAITSFLKAARSTSDFDEMLKRAFPKTGDQLALEIGRPADETPEPEKGGDPDA